MIYTDTEILDYLEKMAEAGGGETLVGTKTIAAEDSSVQKETALALVGPIRTCTERAMESERTDALCDIHKWIDDNFVSHRDSEIIDFLSNNMDMFNPGLPIDDFTDFRAMMKAMVDRHKQVNI